MGLSDLNSFAKDVAGGPPYDGQPTTVSLITTDCNPVPRGVENELTQLTPQVMIALSPSATMCLSHEKGSYWGLTSFAT